jgi:hypothetical protein
MQTENRDNITHVDLVNLHNKLIYWHNSDKNNLPKRVILNQIMEIIGMSDPPAIVFNCWFHKLTCFSTLITEVHSSSLNIVGRNIKII